MFTIDTDNSITYHDTDAAAQAAVNEGVQAFSSQKELAKITADWPTSRLIEVWNDLAGVPPFQTLKPVKKFTDRKTAANRIWSAIQVLAGAPARSQTDAPQAAQGAPEAPAATTEASPKKGAPKAQKGVKRAKPARAGTAKATVIAMMQRKGGATLDEIMKITRWQKHTVRGFVSILGSKGGMKIASSKREDGVRVYEAAK